MMYKPSSHLLAVARRYGPIGRCGVPARFSPAAGMRRIRSIGGKIFFGCLSLTLVTIFVGYCSQRAQTKLSDTTLSIYDDAFQSMNYLRSAQSISLGMIADLSAGQATQATLLDQLRSAYDALDVSHERAMSPDGVELTERLQAGLLTLQAILERPAHLPVRKDFAEIERTFDLAVSVYARDGFERRLSAENLVRETRSTTYLAMAGSLVVTLIITTLLSRAIVPSIREAVTIATAIAAGKLDNKIVPSDSGETGLLLTALSSMQDSIADKISHIEQLMSQQSSLHHVEIAFQNTKFETALDHMTLGLRMFDPLGNLVVQNRKFSEMFDGCELPAAIGEGSKPDERSPYHRVLSDGRTIEISEAAMSGGGRVITYEDVSERQQIEERLSYMARHDSLTGLPNRILFCEILEEGARGDRGVSVLCLDLDRFKAVNDTLGHPAGDELLRQVAQRLLKATRNGAVVARLGGDEFAVVQTSSRSRDESRELATQIIDALSAPFELADNQIVVGVSIGISDSLDGTETPENLLKNADLALYSAKTTGKGSYRIFDPAMDQVVQARRRIELDLRLAIAEQQFELYYQPIISVASGAIVAYEALLRWHHPVRGLISPGEFIPVAEETGLIPIIGNWVLERTCSDATLWPAGIKVAVNLSPLQFQYRDLVGDVETALRISGLCPNRLDLEITESLMLQDGQDTLSTLHNLRELGARISMDDFGTGYSALSYLRQFPFDKIKIDRSFTSDITENRGGLAIVQAVIQLGRSLGMSVVAEGVETTEQESLLRQASCHEMQGYLFGRPKPVPLPGKILTHLIKDAA